MKATDKNELVAERSKTHGDPWDNFAIIADLWTAYMRAHVSKDCSLACDFPDLTREDVALLMDLMKIGRIKSGPRYHADHYDDIRGYTDIAEDMATREGNRVVADPDKSRGDLYDIE